MALPTPFSAGQNMQVLRPHEHFVKTPPAGFNHLGALETVGEDDGDFEDFCAAARRIDEAVENDEQLAEDIATMLNRAYAYGLMQAQTPAKA